MKILCLVPQDLCSLSLELVFLGVAVAAAGWQISNVQAWENPSESQGQSCPSAPSTPPCPHPWGRKVADTTEGSGTLVMWLNRLSLPASAGFLLLSTCLSRGEHMGLGDLMFHGLLGCQNALHYYLLQHSRWSSLRKKKKSKTKNKPVRQVPRCPCWEQMSEREHC